MAVPTPSIQSAPAPDRRDRAPGAPGVALIGPTDALAAALRGVFAGHLAQSDHRLETVNLHILLTLSKPIFRKQLLFNKPGEAPIRLRASDGRQISIAAAAVAYFDLVLGRPLGVAPASRGAPGVIHRLLLHWLARGPAQPEAAGATMARELGFEVAVPDLRIARTHRAFAEIRRRREAASSAIARRVREARGPLILRLGRAADMAPDELSLLEAVNATTGPVEAAVFGQPEVQRDLARAVDSLNARYGLCRSLGLDPQVWAERETPSIDALRKLKTVRRRAREMIAAAQRRHIDMRLADAWEAAFAELQGDGAKLAGFESFEGFAASEIGRALLGDHGLSLEAVGGDDDAPLGERLTGDPDPELAAIDRADAARAMAALVARAGDAIEPALRLYISEALGRGRPLHDGPLGSGLLGDGAFQAALRDSPSFRGLKGSTLAEQLHLAVEAMAVAAAS